jgi:cytidine deaminase
MSEISEAILQDLEARARSASEHAYCRYSHFQVGAAVLSDGGEIFSGCNVENSSYGLTMCAERVALLKMVSEGSQRVNAIVIYTPTDEPTAPCGACRQVINEFGPEALVVSVCDGADALRLNLRDLLPKAFEAADLE